MYLQRGLSGGFGPSGLGACVVPPGVTVRRLVLTDADRAAIGTRLRLGRAATVDEVRTIITDAAKRAVALIGRAAGPLRHPRATGPDGEATRLHFRDAFGIKPEFVPAWRPAGQTWDLGSVVAERLRCAAKMMSEGDIKFVAWGPGSCPFPDVRWLDTTWAAVQPKLFPHGICLGPQFWHAWRGGDVKGMATTLLHECLHLYIKTIVDEVGRGPYNRAACYELYVLLANGLLVPDVVRTPCGLGPPVGDFPVRKRGSSTGLGWIGQPTAVACAPESGEIVASRTDAGILTKDVELTDKGVLVTDFGVNRGSVKPGARAELAPTLALLENDDVKTIRITGFDDCLNASPQVHRYYRKRRALKVREMLGPRARAKVTFAGGAPLGTFIGPNADRAARARNRSVLIEFVKEVNLEPEQVTAPSCTQQLMRIAIDHLHANQQMDAKLKSRVSAAIRNSQAGHDDSFIQFGSLDRMFTIHWSGIKQYFGLICAQPGGAAALGAAGLTRKLVELDQDIVNGVESLRREERNSFGHKKAILDAQFRTRLDALLRNKSQTVYAVY
jgi:hypothetical protein